MTFSSLAAKAEGALQQQEEEHWWVWKQQVITILGTVQRGAFGGWERLGPVSGLGKELAAEGIATQKGGLCPFVSCGQCAPASLRGAISKYIETELGVLPP